MVQTIRLRVREGKSSADAEQFRFILGRKVGNAWADLALDARQLATLRAAGIFEFIGEPPPEPSRLVCLVTRDGRLEGRRRVVVRGTHGAPSGSAA